MKYTSNSNSDITNGVKWIFNFKMCKILCQLPYKQKFTLYGTDAHYSWHVQVTHGPTQKPINNYGIGSEYDITFL